MKTTYCPFDTHKKEITCPYYEKGKIDNYGCSCKFMKIDECFNIERNTNDVKKLEAGGR